MKKRLRLILLITAGLLGLAIVPAYADNLLGKANVANTNPNDLTNVVSQTLANTPLKQNQTTDYWTPERMQKAAPVPVPLADGNPADGLLKNVLPAGGGLPASPIKGKLPIVGGQQQAAPPQPETEAPVTPAKMPAKPPAKLPGKKTKATNAVPEWDKGGKTAATSGKVFFVMGGTNYVGSATVIKSQNRDLVITAGHVVNEGPGNFADKWMFAPGYQDGKAPYGEWTARRLMASPGWVKNGSLNEDVGFAVLNARGGNHIGDVVKQENIAFNAAKGKSVKAFGYPLAPYSGGQLHYCTDTTRADAVDSKSTDVAITCPMPEGASGGKWSAVINGVDTVVSVNSFSYNNTPDIMNGPNFNNNIRALYNQAQRA